MKNAVRIHERDNVAVVIEPISKGELCIYTDAQGMEQGVAVRECIPVYHKLALSRIHKGEPVVKYGEWIGIAACDIEQGMYGIPKDKRESAMIIYKAKEEVLT